MELHELSRGENGKPLPTVTNAVILMALVEPPLKYNEFSNRIEWGDAPLRDVDITDLRTTLERRFGGVFSADMAYQAIESVAYRKKYHPVREYLEGLRWDGVPRLKDLFGSYFITPERKPLYEAASRCFGVGAVARVFQPGAKLDTYPVLEGKQGIFKSSGIAALVPKREWFSDTRIDLGSKDAYISLNGKWIYEVAELDSFKGWGSTRLKSFVSSASDSYRPPYGRILQNVPRQTVFIATTNDSDYVSDSTGERRKWPVPVTSVDIEAIRRDRDALWAESVVAYRAGEPWYLEGEAAEEMMEAAESKMEADPLDERLYEDVMHKLLILAEQPNAELAYVTAGQIYEAIQSDSTKASPGERRRISESLRKLGFKPGNKRRVDGKPSNVWLVPDGMRAKAEAKRAAGLGGGIASVGTA